MSAAQDYIPTPEEIAASCQELRASRTAGSEEFDHREVREAKLERCPDCGGKVVMPCVRCAVAEVSTRKHVPKLTKAELAYKQQRKMQRPKARKQKPTRRKKRAMKKKPQEVSPQLMQRDQLTRLEFDAFVYAMAGVAICMHEMD